MNARCLSAVTAIGLLFLAFGSAHAAGGALPAVPAVPKTIAQPPDQAGTQHVALGGQRMVTIPGPVTRIALVDPTLEDVKLLSAKQLRLVGLKPGITDLTIWSRSKPEGETYPIAVG